MTLGATLVCKNLPLDGADKKLHIENILEAITDELKDANQFEIA
jgi:hypothetical protein